MKTLCLFYRKKNQCGHNARQIQMGCFLMDFNQTWFLSLQGAGINFFRTSCGNVNDTLRISTFQVTSTFKYDTRT
jgi:hypothetical protein